MYGFLLFSAQRRSHSCFMQDLNRTADTALRLLTRSSHASVDVCTTVLDVIVSWLRVALVGVGKDDQVDSVRILVRNARVLASNVLRGGVLPLILELCGDSREEVGTHAVGAVCALTAVDVLDCVSVPVDCLRSALAFCLKQLAESVFQLSEQKTFVTQRTALFRICEEPRLVSLISDAEILPLLQAQFSSLPLPTREAVARIAKLVDEEKQALRQVQTRIQDDSENSEQVLKLLGLFPCVPDAEAVVHLSSALEQPPLLSRL
jgi:hypothetical protein